MPGLLDSKVDVAQPQLVSEDGNFPCDPFGPEDNPSVMILYVRDESGEVAGKTLTVPFKQRGTGNEMYAVEVKDLQDLKELLLHA